jgi:hypothetical protein
MHRLLIAISVLFGMAAAAAADPDVVPETANPPNVVQPSPPSASEAAKKPQPPRADLGLAAMSPAEIRKTSDAQFKQCLQDWDAATHMTKKEWERTCRRVVDARVKFLAEQRGK